MCKNAGTSFRSPPSQVRLDIYCARMDTNRRLRRTDSACEFDSKDDSSDDADVQSAGSYCYSGHACTDDEDENDDDDDEDDTDATTSSL